MSPGVLPSLLCGGPGRHSPKRRPPAAITSRLARHGSARGGRAPDMGVRDCGNISRRRTRSPAWIGARREPPRLSAPRASGAPNDGAPPQRSTATMIGAVDITSNHLRGSVRIQVVAPRSRTHLRPHHRARTILLTTFTSTERQRNAQREATSSAAHGNAAPFRAASGCASPEPDDHN
jgi:hypothetical protein